MLDKSSTYWKIYPTCHSCSGCHFHYSYSFPACLTFFNVALLCWHLNVVFQKSLKGRIRRDLIWPLLHSVKMKNYFSHIFVVITNSCALSDWWWDNLPGRHCDSVSKIKQETSVSIAGPCCLRGKERGGKKQIRLFPSKGRKENVCKRKNLYVWVY